jgi:phosphoribosylanthranilate isomerase
MALRTIVKASAINNLSDARYCAGMGVDLIGFDLSARALESMTPEIYRDILSWISGVTIVGEFGNEKPDLIATRIHTYPVDMIEIDQPAYAPLVNKIGPPVIVRCYVDELEEKWQELADIQDDVAYLLLDTMKQQSMEAIKPVVSKLSDNFAVLLGGIVSKDNVLSILESLAIKGINLQGGSEIRPGYKSYDELADILELLEVED